MKVVIRVRQQWLGWGVKASREGRLRTQDPLPRCFREPGNTDRANEKERIMDVCPQWLVGRTKGPFEEIR